MESKYTIYIQKFGGEFIGDYAFTAYEGFSRRGYDIISFEDIEEVPVSRSNLVVACIEDTTKYFVNLGIQVPKPLNIPSSLMGYCNREIHVLPMKEFRENKLFPIFVKPYGKLKEFPAGVITKKSSIDMFFNDIPDDTMVLTSQVVDMVSEYRVFVKDDNVVGIKNYIGNFLVFPHVPTILNMVIDYVDSPSAYTLDVAVDYKGNTILVECNDGWSVGSYGLDCEIYSSFLMRRWVELVRY